MSMTSPLAPLVALIQTQSRESDGKDRKVADATLARSLTSDDVGGALQHAALEHLDAVLDLDELAVELKPLSLLLLLCVCFGLTSAAVVVSRFSLDGPL